MDKKNKHIINAVSIDFNKINRIFKPQVKKTKESNLNKYEKWFYSLLRSNTRLIDHIDFADIMDRSDFSNTLMLRCRNAFFNDVTIIQLRFQKHSICADICDFRNDGSETEDTADGKANVSDCSMYTTTSFIVIAEHD